MPTYSDSCDFLSLPDETIVHVLKYVTVEDIFSIFTTCKRLNHCAQLAITPVLNRCMSYLKEGRCASDIMVSFAIRDEATAVRWMLTVDGVDINTLVYNDTEVPAPRGTPLLFMVALLGHHVVFDLLLKAGAMVESVTKITSPPDAFFIPSRADTVALKGEFGWSPLGELVMYNKEEYQAMFKSLVSAGINVNSQDQDFVTPLMKCVVIERCDLVKMLLQAGALPNIKLGKDRDGYTALSMACAQGQHNIVKLLIEAGAHVKNSEYYHGKLLPLHIAAERGHDDIIKTLVEAGADINYFDRKAMSPLFYAIKEGMHDTVKTLIQMGASVNAKNSEEENSSLHFAAQYGNVEILETLMTAGASINLKNRNGDTPVVIARYYKRGDIAKKMLPLVNNAGATNKVGAARRKKGKKHV